MSAIYLDAHATTPVHPVVFEAMTPYFCTHFGNASSDHRWGWKATAAVGVAKKQISQLVDCQPAQVFTTSGATESIHWVIMGWVKKNPGGKVITTASEHKATFGACDWAKTMGADVVVIGTDSSGQVLLDELAKHLSDRPTLVSFIHGNNEIGTLNPVKKIVELCRQYPQTKVHVDGAQSVGKSPVSFADWDVDYLSFSGHKLYAPKGIGALIIKDNQSLEPLFLGGGQQMGMRAGTLNVPSIVVLVPPVNGVLTTW